MEAESLVVTASEMWETQNYFQLYQSSTQARRVSPSNLLYNLVSIVKKDVLSI